MQMEWKLNNFPFSITPKKKRWAHKSRHEQKLKKKSCIWRHINLFQNIFILLVSRTFVPIVLVYRPKVLFQFQLVSLRRVCIYLCIIVCVRVTSSKISVGRFFFSLPAADTTRYVSFCKLLPWVPLNLWKITRKLGTLCILRISLFWCSYKREHSIQAFNNGKKMSQYFYTTLNI